MSAKTVKLIKENEVKWVDLRFTDTKGKEQHVSIPATEVDSEFFEARPPRETRRSDWSP